MSLLTDEDYADLRDAGMAVEEDEANRFLIFKAFALPPGMYTVQAADILLVVPPNYNQAGNDMFWTYPRLAKSDGQGIINTNNPGDNDNRTHAGLEYCRWSRHWADNMTSRWRPGRDNAMSMYRRVEDAINNPHRP